MSHILSFFSHHRHSKTVLSPPKHCLQLPSHFYNSPHTITSHTTNTSPIRPRITYKAPYQNSLTSLQHTHTHTCHLYPHSSSPTFPIHCNLSSPLTPFYSCHTSPPFAPASHCCQSHLNTLLTIHPIQGPSSLHSLSSILSHFTPFTCSTSLSSAHHSSQPRATICTFNVYLHQIFSTMHPLFLSQPTYHFLFLLLPLIMCL